VVDGDFSTIAKLAAHLLRVQQQAIEEECVGIFLEARKLGEDLMPLWPRRGGLIWHDGGGTEGLQGWLLW
jgi:hypothetical protein